MQTEVTAEAMERLVAAVLHDHEAERQSELGGGGQPLDGIHRRTVTQYRYDFLAGPPERAADRRWQAMTATTARAGVEGVRCDERQPVVHSAAAGGCFFDDDRAFRPQPRHLLEEESVGEGGAVERLQSLAFAGLAARRRRGWPPEQTRQSELQVRDYRVTDRRPTPEHRIVRNENQARAFGQVRATAIGVIEGQRAAEYQHQVVLRE